MVIDFHAHIFPDDLAPKAIAAVSAKSGGLRSVTDGTLSGTLAKGKLWGIDRFVFMHIATNPKQQSKVNEFALSLVKQGQYSFGSVHPAAEDAVSALAGLKSGGISGIKLHPHYQNFAPDDPKLAPLYEEAVRLSLPILFHSGQDIAYPENDLAAPARIAAVVRGYPGLTVIAAHMGGWQSAYEVFNHLAGLPVYFDTSFSDGYCNPAEGAALVSAHGAERFLFGTDAPWMDGPSALAFVESLGLSEAEKEQIFYQNALRLL